MLGQGYGSFPEWVWREYVLADGWVHARGFPRLLLAGRCDVLCYSHASSVLARIFYEDPETCKALRAAYDIPRYVRLMKAGKLSLDDLITHEFPLDRINDAIGIMRSGSAGRVLVRMD